jgi:hypothetical protein
MATPKLAVLATLGKANHAAILNRSSGGALNEARANVGIALSNLIHDHGPPTPHSIYKAKRAIEAWIRELVLLSQNIFVDNRGESDIYGDSLASGGCDESRRHEG